jgi:hypothetical protein
MTKRFAVHEPGLSDPAALCKIGPLIMVTVGAHPEQVANLERQQLMVPAPQGGKAIIDTGAETTLVHLDILTALQVLSTLRN